jgi:TolB-like protein
MQRGDQLMLSLELVNAETENVIWSEQYNRTQADLVSLQSEIPSGVCTYDRGQRIERHFGFFLPRDRR